MATTAVPTMTPEYMAESESAKLITVMWIVTVLPMIFVGLRVYVRLCVKKHFGWDDAIACVALVSDTYLQLSDLY